MATAVELTFQALPYLPAGPIRFAGTLGIITDAEIQTSGTFYTSMGGTANSFDVVESVMDSGVTGSVMLGDATSFGFIETPDIPATMSGSYFVNSINSEIYEIPSGEKNHDETSSDNPTPAEIGTNFEWNHFPIPDVVTPEATSPRDLTRFKKAYSFTRQQPVRVRIYRR